MPPKPRPLRKASTSKDAPPAVVKVEKDPPKPLSDSMPPPPVPVGILEPEINALSTCLKNAIVKTGQIYGFYADTRRLKIHNQAPNPPRSLTAALGCEIERYDQLCDSLESQLLRAISVLKRDLAREVLRTKEAESAADANRTRSKSTSVSPTSTRVPLPPTSVDADSDASTSASGGQVATHSQTSSSPSLPGRRPSTISISSLQRPPFPLKLDLSSSSLRITAEEASLFSTGLASPVTLAPKSARPLGPNELPPDLMAALTASAVEAEPPVDIDLTVADIGGDVSGDVQMSMDVNLGNTADKPIELDLDAMDLDMTNMNDLFGEDSSSNDANTAVDGLFSPINGQDVSMAGPSDANDRAVKEEEKLGMEILDALSAASADGNVADNSLFGSLGDAPGVSSNNAGDIPLHPFPDTTASAAQASASPGSLLASFASAADLHPTNRSGVTSQTLEGGDQQFDLASLDLLDAGFFTDTQDSDMNLMEEFLNIGGQKDAETSAIVAEGDQHDA